MDTWSYEPTPDFDQAPIERLENFPRHPDFVVYAVRSVVHCVIRLLLRVWHRFEVIGRENLPVEGSFVIVANHASHLDAPALLCALPLRKIHRAFPAAARDYFFTSASKLVFSAVVVNAMPFDRKDNPQQSLALCRQLLDAPGHILILFPEGTRTVDGTIARFKPGVGFLVSGTSIPVVPCHLDGAYASWPKGKWFPRPRKLRLVIGKPVTFEQLRATKEDAIEVANRLREAVVSLR